MIGKLIPILLALVGLGAGIGGGLALRPAPVAVAMDMENPCGDMVAHDDSDHDAPMEKAEDETSTVYDYVKLNNQFIVPVVEDGKISSLVVLSLSLEVESGQNEEIYRLEPKLRDIYLQLEFRA